MKTVSLVAALVVLSATSAFAGTKSYQVTGPVTELNDKSITVQKGSESWQIGRDSDTKLPETVKVGSKVTVYYSMTASKVEDKSPASHSDSKADTKADSKADAKTKADTKSDTKTEKKAK